MDYQYEILQTNPTALFVQVKFSSDGKTDQMFNIIAKPFTEENILNEIARFGQEAVTRWQEVDSVPPDFSLSTTTGAGSYVLKETVDPGEPVYDPFTQRVEVTTEETDTQFIVTYTVIPLTQAEQDEYLANFRKTTAITMRQCRLVLLQQGLLDTVNTNIGSLTQESQIEWEYGAVVERNSPLVASLGASLGLSEEQLDDLFAVAAGL